MGADRCRLIDNSVINGHEPIARHFPRRGLDGQAIFITIVPPHHAVVVKLNRRTNSHQPDKHTRGRFSSRYVSPFLCPMQKEEGRGGQPNCDGLSWRRGRARRGRQCIGLKASGDRRDDGKLRRRPASSPSLVSGLPPRGGDRKRCKEEDRPRCRKTPSGKCKMNGGLVNIRFDGSFSIFVPKTKCEGQ